MGEGRWVVLGRSAERLAMDNHGPYVTWTASLKHDEEWRKIGWSFYYGVYASITTAIEAFQEKTCPNRDYYL